MSLIRLRRFHLWTLLVVIIAAVGGSVLWRRVASEKARLPIFGQVSDFTLMDQTGQPFGSDTLKGRVWVADFIFTHCEGPCPLMTREMATLQPLIAKRKDAYLVSFSVDPERDTPNVLSDYARQYGADRERWFFLTGHKEAIFNLALKSFRLGAKEASLEEEGVASGSIIHSTRFVLVDRAGKIRGYYDGTDQNSLQKLRQDLQILIKIPI